MYINTNTYTYIYTYTYSYTYTYNPGPRFGPKNNVRLALNSDEKNFFHCKAPASFSVECGQFLRFLAMKNFFHRIHRNSYKKEISLHGFKSLIYCISTTSQSTAASVTSFNNISCEFKISGEINVCKLWDFSAEKLFSPHSAGSGEKFFSTIKR